MKKNRNIGLLIVSIGCGVLATFLAVFYLKTNAIASPTQNADLVRILITKQSLQMGEVFAAENINVVNWPKKEVPEGAYKSFLELKGMVATSQIPRGIPVTKELVISKEESLLNRIPKNHRAMTIDMTKQGGVPEFVETGSFVDVIATFDEKSKNPITKTILQGVRVMKIARKQKSDSLSKDRITLLLKIVEAEKLTLALAKGSIQITLRSQEDIDMIRSEGINSDELIWGAKKKNSITEEVGERIGVKLPQRQTVEVIRGSSRKIETLKY